jgi:hypothetical protein
MRRLAIASFLALAAACDEGNPITGFTPATLPAIKLAVSVQPSDAASGIAITPPIQILVQNNKSETVTGSSAPVTLAITPGTGPAGATPSGQLIVSAVNGVATFNNVRIVQPGTYSLTATSGSLTPATTSTFTISP